MEVYITGLAKTRGMTHFYTMFWPKNYYNWLDWSGIKVKHQKAITALNLSIFNETAGMTHLITNRPKGCPFLDACCLMFLRTCFICFDFRLKQSVVLNGACCVVFILQCCCLFGFSGEVSVCGVLVFCLLSHGAHHCSCHIHTSCL